MVKSSPPKPEIGAELRPGVGADAGSEAAYAELHCISNFTFLRGASFPEELVEQADALAYRAIAITDECSVAGVVRAFVAMKGLTQELKLLIGSFFVVTARRRGEAEDFNQNDPFYRLNVWARETIRIHPFLKRRGWDNND